MTPSGGVSQSAVSSVIETTDGEKLLLTGIEDGSYYGKQTFTYDEQGRPKTLLEEDDYGYTFSYNPFKISFYEDDDEETITGTLNSRGYLSSMTSEWNDEWEEDEESYSEYGKETAYLDYDSEGHLVKVTFEWEETEYEDGKKYTDKGTDVMTLTWKDGNLVKIEDKEEWDDGYWENIVEITYGDQKNQYNQYTCGIANELTGAMSLVGMTGKGTAYLPTTIKETEVEVYDDEEDPYEYTSNENYTYTLNSNGTIATETRVYEYGSRYTYTYNYATVGSTRSMTPVVKNDNVTPVQKKNKRNRLFGSRRHRIGANR